MNDRGEKIVHLARAMLHAEAPLSGDLSLGSENKGGIKVLLFTAFVSAFAGGAGAYAYTEASRPLSHYERTELEALIFYVARQKEIDTAQVKRDIEENVIKEPLDALTLVDYRAVRAYLHQKIR